MLPVVVVPDGANLRPVRIDKAEHRVLASGRFLELVEDRGWEYVRRPTVSGAVAVVATTDDGEIVLVEQPRIPVRRRTIELPAGLVGDLPAAAAEPLEDAAARELEEETGFRAARWHRLYDVPLSVGTSPELLTLFRATGLVRVGPGGGDHTEDITVHLVPLHAVAAFLAEKIATSRQH